MFAYFNFVVAPFPNFYSSLSRPHAKACQAEMAVKALHSFARTCRADSFAAASGLIVYLFQLIVE